MKRASFYAAALLTLALAACSAPAGEETPLPAASPSPPASTAPAGPRWEDQVFSRDYTAGDGAVVMSVDYSFPGCSDPESHPAWAAVAGHYAAEGAAYLESADELSAWALGDYETAAALGEEFLPFGEAADWRVSYQSETLVSFVRSYYSNSVSGAAHPAYYQFSEVFSLEDGALLSLEDLFTDPEAARAAVLDILAEKAAPSGYGREGVEAAFDGRNFYLTGEGFVFYFQPDTLAPYAAGLLEFAVPYGALEDLLSRPLGAA